MATSRMDAPRLAREVLDAVGGQGNVRSLTHCATRLRFVLADPARAQTERIEGLDGVVAVRSAGGQYQVVVGDEVPRVYAALHAIASFGVRPDGTDAGATPDGAGPTPNAAETAPGTPGATPEGASSPAPQGASRNLFNRFIALIAELFTPMLWPLAGAGLFKALLTLAVALGFDKASQEHTILYAASDALIYFLPALIALSAAKRFGANAYTSLALAGFLLYPSVIALNTAGEPVSFFGIPVVMVSYVSSVIPMIVVVWVQGHLERRLLRVLPASLRNFTTPLIVLALLSVVTLLTIGPATVALAQGISGGIEWLFALSPVVAGAVLGGLWQVLVIFGLHWGIVPILINDIATLGYSVMKTATAAAVLAQGAAALAVFFRVRERKLRQAAAPAGLSGLVAGVTEPAVYGVNLPLKRPFVIACVAGAIGGAIATSGGSAADVTGLPSLLSLTGYMNYGNFAVFLTGMATAMALAFVLTYLFGVPAERRKAREAPVTKPAGRRSDG
ncbi:PTS transporter subunit EIIC [Rothia halotolerans]|uniref:PTS transporter subunit EIIC n=1 Tax=Rothia halotolerans TaxID=405770 RepID=UPI00101DCE1F|nr:PTS transporter subunit EIIC [Rothia halotolerans]